MMSCRTSQASREVIISASEDECSTQRAALFVLPPELMCNILAFLEITDLLQARLACKYLNRLGEDPTTWKRLHMRYKKAMHLHFSASHYVEAVEIEAYGWYELTKTLLKKKCFDCGSTPR